MKNRNCKWRLIGLATGWLFIGNALAVEPAPDANATVAANVTADTNATVAANVTADANATDANATAAKPRDESVSSQRIYGLPQAQESYQPKPVNLMEVVFRIFGALLVVLALLLGGAWWFRKSRLFGLVPASQSNLKIIETKSLGSRHAMHVVAYGEQRFLISDSPVGTSFLTQLEDPGEEPVEEEPAEEPELGTFAHKLKTLISRAS
jgi:flagellar biogenesis protein FliO